MGKIREELSRRGVTVKRLARSISMDAQRLQRLLRGEVKDIPPDEISHISVGMKAIGAEITPEEVAQDIRNATLQHWGEVVRKA